MADHLQPLQGDLKATTAPVVQEWEAYRLEQEAALERVRKWVYIPISLLVGTIVWGVQGGATGSWIYLVAMVLIGMGSLVWWWLIQNRWSRQVREAYQQRVYTAGYQALFEAVFGHFEYQTEGGIPIEQLRKSGLFKSYNSYNGGIWIKGQLDEQHRFQCGEFEVKGMGANEAPKKFEGLFYVLEWEDSVFQAAPAAFREALAQEKQEVILKMDHDQPMMQFLAQNMAAYTNDRAPVWLTKTMLKTIYPLVLHLKANVGLSFTKQAMYLAVPNKEALVTLPPLNQPITYETFVLPWEKALKHRLELLTHLENFYQTLMASH